MKTTKVFLFAAIFVLFACNRSSDSYNGLTTNMGELYRLSRAKTRSISPENFTGEKGKGGMATLEEGSASRAARELGQGWKVNPYVRIQPGETFVMAEIKGPGAINHIWMTPAGNYRLSIFRFYWDNETEPSVEVPVGDFFASGWGNGNEPEIRSLAVCVNPRSGFNSYWQMPFRKKCRITMENLDSREMVLYYQIDYSLTRIKKDAGYFHAQFRRVNPLPYKQDYTIIDDIRGRGQYVGTYLSHGAYSPGWWGEGEIKFFLDGDTDYPTICGTGEEDYFCGSYGFEMRWDEERIMDVYTPFSSLYTGFYFVDDPANQIHLSRVGEYRWHITDPVRFNKNLRVTIQSLGWKSEGRYLPLQDDLSSVAFWYQTEPHNPFPDLPSPDDLIIVNAKPIDHLGKGKTVSLATEPNSKYVSNPGSLTDGLLGTKKISGGFWMRFKGDDLEAVVDMDTVQLVKEIRVNFLSSPSSWIFKPVEFEILVSTNGKEYQSVYITENIIEPDDNKDQIIEFGRSFDNLNVRYIKIVAKNTGTCPEWHPGSGGKAWLLIDEVIIN